jgi:hypothetical protein
MDSHTFSEPRVVPEAPVQPTWLVDILRLNSGVVAGSLLINRQTFPPRRRKSKVVWKLPDDSITVPRFGEHEKVRLWELFKEQKKQRRKYLKKEPNKESRAEAVEEEVPVNEDSGASSSSSLSSHGQQQQQRLVAPPPGFQSKQVVLDETSSIQYALKQEEPHSTTTLSVEPRYFIIPLKSPLEQPNSSAGAQVAAVFGQCMVSQNALAWTCYHDPASCQSTLLVGQAVAGSHNQQERLSQWQSLCFPSSWWICQGWTQQDVHSNSNSNSNNNNGSTNRLLVVLTGRTAQPTGHLHYSLSLVLQWHEAADAGYHIVNDVLTLHSISP